MGQPISRCCEASSSDNNYMADVIFHGSCLDGCYSGMVVFSFLNLLQRYCKRPLLDIVKEFFKTAKNNLVDDPTSLSLAGDFI